MAEILFLKGIDELKKKVYNAYGYKNMHAVIDKNINKRGI